MKPIPAGSRSGASTLLEAREQYELIGAGLKWHLGFLTATGTVALNSRRARLEPYDEP